MDRDEVSDTLLWRVLGGIAVGGAALAARKVLDGSWRAATGGPPPNNPEDPDVAWKEAITWAVISGAVIGIAQLLAARSAAKYWRHRRGSLPPDLRSVN